MQSYAAAAEVLADRCTWAVAALGALIQEARRDGWLPGESAASADPAASRERIEARLGATPAVAEVQPIEWLAMRLGLSAAQREAIWILACVEAEPRVARLAQCFGTPECPDLSFRILARLTRVSSAEAHQLVRHGLLELTDDPRVPQHRRRVRVTDRVMDLVGGDLALDAAVAKVARIDEGDARHGTDLGLAGDIVAVATGAGGSGRATALVAAARAAGFATLRIRTAELAREPALLGRQLQAIAREAALLELVPLFEDLDADVAAAAQRALCDFGGPILASAAAPIRWPGRSVVVHACGRPDAAARAALWRAMLPAADAQVIDDAARYTLVPGAIVAAARSALAAAAGASSRVTAAHVRAGIRAHLGEQLGALATRVETTQTWDDLVLPPDQFDLLVELCARSQFRGRVLEQWGFAAKVGRGTGTAALLSGPPGTGKTMIAGLVARELGMDLYQVDLAKLVSKYIGETEKQLGALFDAAETGHAILLFDEADSLFGKRTSVKSSTDRYANLEVNYLLQRMEAFAGISILTTNHETAIDPAFMRRLAMHVRVPMPDAGQRAQLWRAMLPAAAAVDDGLDFVALAERFAMSGGYIKNAVVRAAYLAAAAGSAISGELLWRAAHAEYEGMGKLTFGQVRETHRVRDGVCI